MFDSIIIADDWQQQSYTGQQTSILLGGPRRQCVARRSQFFINVVVLGEKVFPQLILAVELSLTKQTSQHQRPFALVAMSNQATLVGVGHATFRTPEWLVSCWGAQLATLTALSARNGRKHLEGRSQHINVTRLQVTNSLVTD